MKNKMIALAAVGIISVGGLSVFANNKSTANEKHNQTNIAGVSPIVEEKLAIVGNITEISEINGETIVRVVGDIEDGAKYEDVLVYVHASTIIGHENQEDLLEIKDLEVGQKVKVNYDGSEREEAQGQISGLRVLISK